MAARLSRWTIPLVAMLLAAPVGLGLEAGDLVEGASDALGGTLDAATGAPAGDAYIVGYAGSFPALLVQTLGGHVVSLDERMQFAVVETPSPEILAALAEIHPNLRYVERNGALFSSATEWDAARWDAPRWDSTAADAARWDAARWDAARWDAARWDAARWDAARWDAARWDAARWDALEQDAARWDAAPWDGTPAVDPGFGNDWHLGAIHAPDAWNTTQAYHARTICVIDSGIDYQHPDLARNALRLADGSFGYDFVNGDRDPMDDGGHGTHVAGIAAAVTGNGHGVAGVSQAYVLGAKVLNATGYGTEAHLASAIAWCADNGAHIGLMALHTEQDNHAVRDAVTYAAGRGLLLVAASGNDGASCDACVAFPAAYAEVIAVAAAAPDATIAPFSNVGNALDLVAPGVQIPGPIPGGYAIANGTSQAAGVAAGAAALTWSVKPSLSATQVMAALVSEPNANGENVEGADGVASYPLLRVDRALAAALK